MVTDEVLVSRLIGKLTAANSPWPVEDGEVFINCEKSVRGQKAIAERMGVGKWQLGHLCNRDPFLAHLLRPEGKWATTADKVFCARVRHERYKSAMNSLKRKSAVAAGRECCS